MFWFLVNPTCFFPHLFPLHPPPPSPGLTRDEAESQRLVEKGLPLPAYEMVMKASHAFNLLDARHAISVTECQRFILRVRGLARAVAHAYDEARNQLDYPLASDERKAVWREQFRADKGTA